MSSIGTFQWCNECSNLKALCTCEKVKIANIDVSSFWCSKCGNFKHSCTCEKKFSVNPSLDLYFPKLETCEECGQSKYRCKCNECEECGRDKRFCSCERESLIKYAMGGISYPALMPSAYGIVETNPRTEIARRSPRLAASLLRDESTHQTFVDLANSSVATEFARQGRGTKFTARRKIFGITVQSVEFRIEPD